MPSDKAVGSSSPSTHPFGFLEVSDLVQIPPEGGGQDIALLVHSPSRNAQSTVRTSGLKSLQTLASEPNPSREVSERYSTRSNASHFTNDPSLVYFRPVTHKRKVLKGDICIAARKSKINVFDQEARARHYDKPKRYSQNIHQGSKMSYDEYLKKDSETPPGMFMNQHGYYMPLAQHGNGFEQYIPEVCVDSGRISPSLFVDKSKIPHEFLGD
jgi:hypothetical protein